MMRPSVLPSGRRLGLRGRLGTVVVLLVTLSVAAVLTYMMINTTKRIAVGQQVPVLKPAGPLWQRPDAPGGVVAIFPEMSVNQVLSGPDVPVPGSAEQLHYAPQPHELPASVLSPRQYAAQEQEHEEAEGEAEEVATGEEIIREFFGQLNREATGHQQEQAAEISMGQRIPPDEVQLGTFAIQLGSFKEEALATSEMRRSTDTYPTQLLGRNWFVERVERSTGVQYRLRVLGFSSFATAGQVCERIVAGGKECIPIEIGQ